MRLGAFAMISCYDTLSIILENEVEQDVDVGDIDFTVIVEVIIARVILIITMMRSCLNQHREQLQLAVIHAQQAMNSARVPRLIIIVSRPWLISFPREDVIDEAIQVSYIELIIQIQVRHWRIIICRNRDIVSVKQHHAAGLVFHEVVITTEVGHLHIAESQIAVYHGLRHLLDRQILRLDGRRMAHLHPFTDGSELYVSLIVGYPSATHDKVTIDELIIKMTIQQAETPATVLEIKITGCLHDNNQWPHECDNGPLGQTDEVTEASQLDGIIIGIDREQLIDAVTITPVGAHNAADVIRFRQVMRHDEIKCTIIVGSLIAVLIDDHTS